MSGIEELKILAISERGSSIYWYDDKLGIWNVSFCNSDALFLYIYKINVCYHFITASIRDGSPEQDHLERLSKELGTKWEAVARRLKFKAGEITAFDDENRKLPDKAFKMLCAWKSRDGKEATYGVLYNALTHDLVQLRDLAETFCLLTME